MLGNDSAEVDRDDIDDLLVPSYSWYYLVAYIIYFIVLFAIVGRYYMIELFNFFMFLLVWHISLFLLTFYER